MENYYKAMYRIVDFSLAAGILRSTPIVTSYLHNVFCQVPLRVCIFLCEYRYLFPTHMRQSTTQIQAKHVYVSGTFRAVSTIPWQKHNNNKKPIQNEREMEKRGSLRVIEVVHGSSYSDSARKDTAFQLSNKRGLISITDCECQQSIT